MSSDDFSFLFLIKASHGKFLSFHIFSNSDFIEDWVTVCTPAKEKVTKDYAGLPFEEQCTKCEKVKFFTTKLTELLSLSVKIT